MVQGRESYVRNVSDGSLARLRAVCGCKGDKQDKQEYKAQREDKVNESNALHSGGMRVFL